MRNMKNILFAVVVVVMFGCLSGCSFAPKTNYIYQDGEKYTAGDREIAERIDTINLNFFSGEVELIGVDDDVVTIHETSEKQLDDKRKVHTWVDGTTLYVRYCASAKRLDLNNLKKHLVISIPKDIKLSDIKVEVSSADVKCLGFEAEKVKMSASSGNVTVDCTAHELMLSASSGNVSLVQHGESGEIKLETSSGNISAKIETAEKISAESSLGNILVNADAVKAIKASTSSGNGEYSFAESPASMDLEASSGNITAYLPEDSDLKADFEVSIGKLYYDLAFAKKGDEYICGEGKNQMKVRTSSGDINVLGMHE